MTRGTFVMRRTKSGKLVTVPKHKAEPKYAKRVNGVISDDLGSDLEHHGYADGRATASKSVFRRWTKEAGLVEKGNDREAPQRAESPSDLRRDVQQAIQMVKQGYRPTIGREW